MKEKQIVKDHPAETKAGALGAAAILAISILEAFSVTVTGAWLKVITGFMAVAPACFTWLDLNEGLSGLVRRILHGRDKVHPGVAA